MLRIPGSSACSWLMAGLLWAAGSVSVSAATPDPCSQFTWNVTHEIAVLKESPQTIAAAGAAGGALPVLQTDKAYELKLNPQRQVQFALQPQKTQAADGAFAGLAKFHVKTAGLWRVSQSGSYWIDIVAGGKLIQSLDFQARPGCSRPHKVVLFDLPAGVDLILQLSGGTDQDVELAITPAG